MEKTTASITTSLPIDIWKQAMIAEISWSEALKLGINALLGTDNEESKIREKIGALETELRVLQEKLKQVKTNENQEKYGKIRIVKDLGVKDYGKNRHN